jgi:cytochrome c oxidase cbb3-type subunit 3
MSDFWSFYIILFVAINIGGNAWILYALRENPDDTVGEGEELGHEFDGIRELNNPLPRWWLWVFAGSIVFSIAYLVAYPGLGNFPGVLGWTSVGQWEEEMEQAQARYGPILEEYAKAPIPELLEDKRAVAMGGRLFANHCAACHGSDARGGKGYPNLTDGSWLYGGDPEIIETTILHGRNGMMPPMGVAVGGEEETANVAEYVLSLSGREHDAAKAALGKPKFDTICAACHGLDGKGNPAIGSANLTDNTWLHGGSAESIRETIRDGRISKMPAHLDLLGEEKVHLLALYVYSLSQPESSEETEPESR